MENKVDGAVKCGHALTSLGARPDPASDRQGSVALVGAGPGDPELLTLRALRRLQAADVVLHDSLISADVFSLIPSSAELIDVGKRCGDVKDRGLQQREIHELLLSHCHGGKAVVRLKSGDPFVFGRGGEEVEYLARHGVVAEVVPGITSALGAGASCQVPLTHRDFGVNQIRFLVGQSRDRALPDVNWVELARDAKRQTVVFYMGLKSLDSICSLLKENGAPEDTPMALVESATTSQERCIFGSLGTMPVLVKEAGHFGGPVLLYLGPTAGFPAHLDRVCGSQPAKRARVTPTDAC